MDLESYRDKIYVIKSALPHPDFNVEYHSSRWVSPRSSGIRIDRHIDIPFANINFIAAYIIGEWENGQRFIELGAIGFPLLIQAPFVSLSANEFRFPSKKIDHNIRFVLGEIISNCRYVGISKEMQQFLLGEKLISFSKKADAKTHVTSLYHSIKDKAPFRCTACKKILWVNYTKLSDKQIQGRCPSCANVLLLKKLDEFDSDLNRYHSSTPVGEGFAEQILQAGTGEFVDHRREETSPAPSDHVEDKELSATPNMEKAKLPQQTPSDDSLNIELDDDFFNEIIPDSKPQADDSLPPSQVKEDGPFPADVEPPPEEDIQGIPSGLDTEEDLGLDDSYFQDITPETIAPLEEKIPDEPPRFIAESAEPERANHQTDAVQSETAEDAFPTTDSSRKCHVCGAVVGGEKICPSCFAEIPLAVDSMYEIAYPESDSGMEIKLKGTAVEEDAAKKSPSVAPEFEDELAKAKRSELSGDTPYWEQNIWDVKVEDEIYEKLDFKTVEEWILERSIVETDLIRKGDSNWVELGTVPYFKNSFKTIRETIQLGKSDAMGSFSPAPHSRRILAMLLDLILCVALFWIGSIIYALPMLASREVTFIDLIMFFIGPHVFLPLLYLSISNGIFGRSLGKKVLSLAVITPDSKPIGLFRGIIRTLFCWGFFISLFNPKRQGLEDLVVNSYVIHVG